MTLSPSAHEDTFARDHLPPRGQWPTLEFTLPGLRYRDRLNAAAALVDEGAERFGDRPAIRTPEGLLWTYRDLRAASDRVAQVLVDELGVRPGNRVLLREGNTPWLVASWLGALKAGAVLVTTMPMLRPGELVDLLERTTPAVCLSGAAAAPDLREALERTGSGAELVLIGGDDPDRLEERAARHTGAFTAVATAADDVALLCPTSGSTGRPKITMHFHRDVLANADTFARHVLRPGPEDVFAGSPPLAFTFGLGGLVVFPLRFGASTVLTERATPMRLAEVVAEHGVTVLFTAPTAYRAIIRGGGAGLLRGVRVGVSAGEHLSEETFDLVREECGVELVNGIGCTELLHVFLSTAPGRTAAGTLGIPVPGYRATVLGPDDAEVGPGVPGRLAVIGPTGCRYLDDARQLGYVVDGWNVTGDTVVRDADGTFRFQARSDSMIVSSGYNIGGPEVEAAICADDAVVEAAVVGRPDTERGAVVCAFVVLRAGEDPGPAMVRRIQDGVKARLAPYKYPRDVRFVDALPRNPSGKLQHFRLRDQLAREADAALRG